MLGIPLHLWNELTIYEIGSCIGKVKKIHNKYSFDTAKVTIILDERRILQKLIKLKEGNQSYNIWIQEIKEHVTNVNESSSEFEVTDDFLSAQHSHRS